MRFAVTLSLVLILYVLPEGCASGVQAQVKTSESQSKSTSETADAGNRKAAGPMVKSWEPKSASVDSLIYLSGYRLNPGEYDKTKAFFIQNGAELPARTGGGWSNINDVHDGPQTLLVIVPDGLVPGPAQIVVEFEGRRSGPAAITITEWKLPVIESLSPSTGAAGTLVRIEGEGFHANDEIEVSDADGKPLNVIANGQVFGVPKNAPDGIINVRIGNRKYAEGHFTKPLTFTVTSEPLTVELLTDESRSVAPGQWLDLQISNLKPLERSERTEVLFKQAGRTIVVDTSKPYRTHVEVPSALSPGEVQLQLRTWREGRSSPWSEPKSFELADKPTAPLIDTLKVGKDKFASLSPGPDRPTSFTVSPGDELVLYGLWPVADASRLKVALIRGSEVVTLSPTEFDEKANWFSDIQVRLPESLGIGEWRMVVSSESDGTQVEVPIPIRVVKR